VDRIASVRVEDPATVTGVPSRRLAASLLAGSPRIALVGPGHCRVDARGLGRRGGEPALARTLREAADAAGFPAIGVGVADVAVAADAAAWLAGRRGQAAPILPEAGGAGTVIVPPGGARAFLAALPLAVLPISADMEQTFRALGFRRVGDLARRGRDELEMRFGPAGLRAHRLACGEDDRIFRPLEPDERPQASLELDEVATLEPLLFMLRRLLDRVCGELAGRGWCARRLTLRLALADGGGRRTSVAPARPTRRERVLFDLCRAALERMAGPDGRLTASVEAMRVRIDEVAPAAGRQEDLFIRGHEDPLAAASALARLRARRVEVVRPTARADHRPETRNAWLPVTMEVQTGGNGSDGAESGEVDGYGVELAERRGPPPSVLRLLPEPVSVRVRTLEGRPISLEGAGGKHRLIAAEGPERISGDWWKDPYRREYYRACTADGELLWVYREVRRSGELRWWLHGWWD